MNLEKKQVEGSKVLSLDRKARRHEKLPVDDLRGFACRVRWQFMLLLKSEETMGLVLTEFMFTISTRPSS